MHNTVGNLLLNNITKTMDLLASSVLSHLLRMYYFICWISQKESIISVDFELIMMNRFFLNRRLFMDLQNFMRNL